MHPRKPGLFAILTNSGESLRDVHGLAHPRAPGIVQLIMPEPAISYPWHIPLQKSANTHSNVGDGYNFWVPPA